MNTPHPQLNSNTRPPVVVVLGHVDHGKTMLLDTIRKTNVVGQESGGITQHIGAYQIEIPAEAKSRDDQEISHDVRDDFSRARKITFLDTPGHEAFTAIRSRGAKVADIAVLVVAADEGVKPQTKEAIKIIKEAKIPFIVAINKIDREGANPQKVKQDLASEEVLVEEWGGKIPAIEVSAKSGKNIPELLEMILLVAELEELKEDLSLPAKGVIIESHLDKRRGYVATALTQKGILKIGDWIVAGTVIGKVKSLEDFNAVPITEAVPSQPVIITGWPTPPDIGRDFETAPSKETAQRIQEENIDLGPLFSFFKETITSAGNGSSDPSKKKLNFILKTDVSSSLEAVEAALKTIPCDEVCYQVIGYDIGNVTEADVKTAAASDAIIVGFRVDTDSPAKKLAERDQIEIQTFDIIYELIAAVRERMGTLLEPEIQKLPLGKLKVLALFKEDIKSQIIGGRVSSGKIARGALVGRGDERVGKITQLQQNKEDVPEVREGNECGLKVELEPGQKVKEGDTLEIYQEEKKTRTL